MALSLVGSKVLITGATSGIGRETAKLLAQSGCVVAITGRRQERLEELESEIKGFGGKVFSFCGDLVDPVTVRTIVSGAADQLNGIDICIKHIEHRIESIWRCAKSMSRTSCQRPSKTHK